MKHKVIFFVVITIFTLHGSIAAAQNKADNVIGIWNTDKQESAKIQIYKSGEKYFGKIIWTKKSSTESGKEVTDKRNPDKKARENPIIGLVILKDFKFDGQKEWKGGSIYNPENGKTYKASFYMADENTLKLRGYVGIPALGKTQTWIKATE